MRRRDPALDPELAALLAFRKVERRAPAEVRARALARARAVVAAGGASAPSRSPWRPGPPAPPVTAGGGLAGIAIAASIALVAGAAGTVAALHGRIAETSQENPAVSPPPVPAVREETVSGPSDDARTVTPERAATAKSPRLSRGAGDADLFTAELELLQRAQAAYTRRDFSGALKLVGEHARRFPNGRLAEEREALRVRLLEGAGRADDALRAARGFAARFPRSVLLPRVEEPSAGRE
jgi:hypothetical protein